MTVDLQNLQVHLGLQATLYISCTWANLNKNNTNAFAELG